MKGNRKLCRKLHASYRSTGILDSARYSDCFNSYLSGFQTVTEFMTTRKKAGEKCSDLIQCLLFAGLLALRHQQNAELFNHEKGKKTNSLLFQMNSVKLKYKADFRSGGSVSLFLTVSLMAYYAGVFLPKLLFYKKFFHKNVEAEINQNFKNMLRTYPG